MQAADYSISAIIGGNVKQFPGGSNAVFGTGKHFVLEADEYDRAFIGIKPTLAIVTNVEWEHVDMFENIDAVTAAFADFVRQLESGQGKTIIL